MMYQLQIKQLVTYPRCRIYRSFIQNLMKDENLHTNGSSRLFYYTVLCSYANFRTSYQRVNKFSYLITPGEWICTKIELKKWFRVRFQYQAMALLEELQEKNYIAYTTLDNEKLVEYKINGW